MSIRIVITEDNEALREGLAHLIKLSDGFECVGDFGNCEDMLACLMEIQPDILIMDVDLPGMSGIEATRIVKQKLPTALILMLTVFEDENRIFEAVMAGASGYLLKSTPPARILESIQELVNGGAPMTAVVAGRLVNMFRGNQPAIAEKFNISEREKDILKGLAQGLSYKQMSEKLFISLDTVRAHIRNIYDKLHVHTKSEAVAKAIQQRLV